MFFRNRRYAVFPCRRPIKMSLVCQIEMTLPGGFAELAYEQSVLKRAWSNKGSGFVGWCIGGGGGGGAGGGGGPGPGAPPPPPPPPTPTIVTSLSGRDGDISIWRTQEVA